MSPGSNRAMSARCLPDRKRGRLLVTSPKRYLPPGVTGRVRSPSWRAWSTSRSGSRIAANG